ncbi:hypothetical protein NMG60_11006462 [Bertholletia excelsa]
MDEKNDVDKIDDIMLPGFRFHPTDEELVGFYLKRKVQQQPLPIELIKQVDIYKFDPWDLPTLASNGEKEWYFYCPRDRKYRNSARPNRVTGAGFWKATGTDRPIYSSDCSKCIGLKKSLVFYRGRAAKGIKTDWMMHEFRLPPISNQAPPKKILDKNLPANDSWAICRIFKKTNSMAQRALSHSWVPETTAPDIFNQGAFSSETISCAAETGSAIQLCSNNNITRTFTDSFSALDMPSSFPTVSKSYFPIPNGDTPTAFMFLPLEMSRPNAKNSVDVNSMLFNLSSSLLEDSSKTTDSIDIEWPEQQFNCFSISSSQDMQGIIGSEEDDTSLRKNPSTALTNNQWENIRSIGFPFSLPRNLPDAWKPTLSWGSPTCPREMSTTYSSNKCSN